MNILIKPNLHPNDLPLSDGIFPNYRLFKIREHGLQDRIHSQVYTERPKCETIGQSFESVRLMDCYAALLFLAYGFAASILFLMGETIVKNGYVSKRCNCNKNQKNYHASRK